MLHIVKMYKKVVIGLVESRFEWNDVQYIASLNWNKNIFEWTDLETLRGKNPDLLKEYYTTLKEKWLTNTDILNNTVDKIMNILDEKVNTTEVAKTSQKDHKKDVAKSPSVSGDTITFEWQSHPMAWWQRHADNWNQFAQRALSQNWWASSKWTIAEVEGNKWSANASQVSEWSLVKEIPMLSMQVLVDNAPLKAWKKGGWAVLILKQFLKSEWYYNWNIDHTFWWDLTNAVKNYQASINIPQTWVVDKTLANLMLQDYNNVDLSWGSWARWNPDDLANNVVSSLDSIWENYRASKIVSDLQSYMINWTVSPELSEFLSRYRQWVSQVDNYLKTWNITVKQRLSDNQTNVMVWSLLSTAFKLWGIPNYSLHAKIRSVIKSNISQNEAKAFVDSVVNGTPYIPEKKDWHLEWLFNTYLANLDELSQSIWANNPKLQEIINRVKQWQTSAIIDYAKFVHQQLALVKTNFLENLFDGSYRTYLQNLQQNINSGNISWINASIVELLKLIKDKDKKVEYSPNDESFAATVGETYNSEKRRKMADSLNGWADWNQHERIYRAFTEDINPWNSINWNGKVVLDLAEIRRIEQWISSVRLWKSHKFWSSLLNFRWDRNAWVNQLEKEWSLHTISSSLGISQNSLENILRNKIELLDANTVRNRITWPIANSSVKWTKHDQLFNSFDGLLKQLSKDSQWKLLFYDGPWPEETYTKKVWWRNFTIKVDYFLVMKPNCSNPIKIPNYGNIKIFENWKPFNPTRNIWHLNTDIFVEDLFEFVIPIPLGLWKDTKTENPTDSGHWSTTPWVDWWVPSGWTNPTPTLPDAPTVTNPTIITDVSTWTWASVTTWF